MNRKPLFALAIISTLFMNSYAIAADTTTPVTATSATKTVAAGVEHFTLDPQHTYVLWHVNHFGFSNQSGKWYASGDIMLDKKNMKDTKLNVTINVEDVVTGIPELDKHLKGESFFDTAQFPTATFVSDKVVSTGKNTAKVTGMLTLHGVTKPVTLNVKLNKEGVNPITEKPTLGFSATTAIKRSDFGMKTMVPGLSDNVDIDINAEAYKAE